MKIVILLNIFQFIGKTVLACFIHLHAVAIYYSKDFIRQYLTCHLQIDKQIFIADNIKIFVFYIEFERSFLFKLFVVIDNTLGRPCDDIGLEQQYCEEQYQRYGCIACIFKIFAQIDGRYKRERSQGFYTLVDTGYQQLVRTRLTILMLKLKGIEKLILYLREMSAYHGRSLLAGKRFAHAQQLGDRHGYIYTENSKRKNDITIKEECPGSAAKASEMLE